MTAKKGIQSRIVQVYIEPGVYVEFRVREDFYNYFDITRNIQPSADKAVTKYKPTTTGAAAETSNTNKGNGVTYRTEGRRLAGKKIKFPVTGASAPPVNTKTPEKKKKTMTIRVPSILSAAALAVWVNTAFAQAKRPTFFTLESGTEIGIDPTMSDQTKLKPLKSVKGKTEP